MYWVLQNYSFIEGPCLTAGLEIQKIKQLNIVGVKKILSIPNFFNFICIN